MFLLINNARPTVSDISLVGKIKSALKYNNIPYYEVKNIKNIPSEISSKIKGILISGSPMRITKPLLFEEIAYIMHYIIKFKNVPILGLCFGCQILHTLYGGKIEDQKKTHMDNYHTELTAHPLFNNVSFISDTDANHSFLVWFNDLPLELPKSSGVKNIAWFIHNKQKLPCAFEYSKTCFGMMIHPEMYVETYPVFWNFAKICGMVK
jgi:GMP synthase-like glutamine amidotransferase